MRFDLRALADAMDKDRYPGGEILRDAADEIERLRRWKDEGLAVLDEWDEVAAMCPQALGLTKASQVKAEIERLRDQLMQTCKPCLDKSDEIERLRATIRGLAAGDWEDDGEQ